MNTNHSLSFLKFVENARRKSETFNSLSKPATSNTVFYYIIHSQRNFRNGPDSAKKSSFVVTHMLLFQSEGSLHFHVLVISYQLYLLCLVHEYFWLRILESKFCLSICEALREGARGDSLRKQQSENGLRRCAMLETGPSPTRGGAQGAWRGP